MHGCFGDRTQVGMDVAKVWAWMLCTSQAIRHGLGYGCFGDRRQEGKDVAKGWAWMFWCSHTTRNGHRSSLGMDAVLIARNYAGFRHDHGCSGDRAFVRNGCFWINVWGLMHW